MAPLVDRPATTPWSRSRASSASTARSSSTPLSRVAEWTWYRSRWSPSWGPALAQLAPQGGHGMVLDLVDLGVHPPVADVGVAHLEPTVTCSGRSPRARSQEARNASARP